MQNARTDFYRDKITNTAILFGESAHRFTASATPPRNVHIFYTDHQNGTRRLLRTTREHASREGPLGMVCISIHSEQGISLQRRRC